MSNPSYGPAGQQSAMPANGTSYPGAAAPQGYGAPAPVAMPKLPGRGGATMIAGVAGTGSNSVQGGATANGSVVTVTADGDFTVMASSSKDPACSLVGADNKSYKLEPYAGSGNTYVASGVPAGSYQLKCDGIASTEKINAFNALPEVIAKVFAMPFLWGTIVGVVGLIVLIVGIVLLVKVNGKRRRITQEALMSALR